MPRPDLFITPKTAISKDWQNPRKLAQVCAHFRNPLKDNSPLDYDDKNILSYVGKKGSRASLKKIMHQLESLYSPISVRKLVTMGYVQIEIGQNDLILVRTEKKCPN